MRRPNRSYTVVLMPPGLAQMAGGHLGGTLPDGVAFLDACVRVEIAAVNDREACSIALERYPGHVVHNVSDGF